MTNDEKVAALKQVFADHQNNLALVQAAGTPALFDEIIKTALIEAVTNKLGRIFDEKGA